MLLISELVKRHANGVRLLLFTQKATQSSSTKGGGDDDDEEEHFHDVPSEDDQPSQTVPQIASWDHKKLNQTKEVFTTQYDIFKRNPLYCGSEFTCLHELLFLKNHSHPTVALFAQNILDEKSIEYDGNPLIDFNSMRFFDRFVYKNPKKQIAKHGRTPKQTEFTRFHRFI